MSVGVGAILRDGNGVVLMAMCDNWRGDCSVEVGEALAVRMEAGFRNLIVEMDCLVLFTALSQRKKEPAYLGVILNDIKLLLEHCLCVSFPYVRRNGNRAAHVLAKKSFNLRRAVCVA